MSRQENPDEVRIVWDENKNRINRRKHRISFEEAATVFYDPLSLTVPDPAHSANERRFYIIGESIKGRLMVVSFADNETEIRIISARKPEASEREDYEQGD